MKTITSMTLRNYFVYDFSLFPLQQQSFFVCADNDSKQFGSCTPAKRSSDEKYRNSIASTDCNLTQFSSAKLGKEIKTE
jgi:hypothetical protein